MATIKILILEHDLNDLELLQRALKKSDLDFESLLVENRPDYGEALHNFKPDIILSDFSLPNFDGLAAYKMKQEICPETPFIIVSGTIGEEKAVDLIKMGITDYALKEKMYQVIPKIQRALNEAGERLKIRIAEQELAEQAALTQNILESITDAFASLDRNWIVRYWNKEAESILGKKRKDIIGQNFLDLYLEAMSLRFYTEIHKVMNEGTSAAFEEYFEPLKIWLDFNVYPSRDGISIFFKDITEVKRVQSLDRLKKEVLQLHTSQGSTIEGTIKLLLEGIQNIHSELLCSVLKVEDGKLYNWAFSQLPDAFITATEGTQMTVGAAAAGTAAFLKERVVSTDIENDPLWKSYKTLAADNGLKACVAYPCLDPNKKVLGIFAVYLKTARALTTAEEASLERAKFTLQHIVENHIASVTLIESEAKYRHLFHLSPLPMWVYDPQTFRFLNVNEAAIRHYGYTMEEFLGMSIQDIRPVDAVKEVEKIANKSLASGEYFTGVFDHIKKNGELIHVVIESTTILFDHKQARLVLAIDNTEKIRAEQALKTSENRFKALVQEGSDLINIMALDGTYKYAGPALAAFVGKDEEGMIGINALEYIHQDDREMVINALLEIQLVKRVQTAPFRFKDFKGEYRWLQAIGTNLLDDPAIEGIVVNSRDITESINYIRAIEQQNGKLRDIAWTQSHIVRAPLSRIMGLIDLISNYPENKPVATELLAHILSSAHELDDIIREIVRKTEQVEHM